MKSAISSKSKKSTLSLASENSPVKSITAAASVPPPADVSQSVHSHISSTHSGDAPPSGDSVKSVAPSVSQTSAKSVIKSNSVRSVKSVEPEVTAVTPEIEPEVTVVTPEVEAEVVVAPTETAPSFRSASPL